MTLAALAHLTTALAGGTTWDRIGPWNIFDDKDGKGESGTVACAASPAGNPNVIYAGGQNNGVSSGVIKTIDGGKHWTRNSKGLWDTRILGVWVHPDDAQGNHVCPRRGLEPRTTSRPQASLPLTRLGPPLGQVLAGTHSGIYESMDGAASWSFRNESTGWGNVQSFREGVIQGRPYVLANSQNGILTMPRAVSS